MSLEAKSYFDANAPNVVLKSLFLKYDKDGSEKLQAEELRTLFEEDLGLNADAAKAYSLLLDKDGSGEVSFEEFKAWLSSGEKFKNVNDESRLYRLSKAVEMFEKYDVDGGQSLSAEEFQKLHADIGGKPEKLQEALAALDKDGNGKISFPEYLKWLNWVPMDDF